MLLFSCAGNCPAPAAPQLNKCKISKWSLPPEIPVEECGDKVCLSVESVVRLAEWLHYTKETLADLAACPLIEVVDDGDDDVKAFAFPDPLKLGATLEMFRVPGVEYTVSWKACGQINAYYSHRKRHITLCYELLEASNPGTVRFILGHEIGHAVIRQLRVPFTGLEEAAADEFSAVILGWYGQRDDVLVAGRWFVAQGGEENPWDEHPGNMRRGITLACLYLGVEAEQSDCTYEWLRASSSWQRLLNL